MAATDLTPFSPQDAAAARAAGHAFVCSMCLKLHEGRKLMALVLWEKVTCKGHESCRGPFGGGCFHDYEGPIKHAFDKQCWQCDGATNQVLDIKQGQPPMMRSLGSCSKHTQELREKQFEGRKTGTPLKQKVKMFGHEVEL